jgi:hypothetical protein
LSFSDFHRRFVRWLLSEMNMSRMRASGSTPVGEG